MLTILFDAFQEAMWFKNLHQRLDAAHLSALPSSPNGKLAKVLAYDRPDIVLLDEGEPILVIEKTIEVPSGHNVGQRFARLAAAAQERVPTIYFGPYAAFKHGGETAGPRFMNLRLFKSIDYMNEIEDSAVMTVRWPVDKDYEIVLDNSKDVRMVAFMSLFFDLYDELGVPGMTHKLRTSSFETEQEAERSEFIYEEVTNPQQYDCPPPSLILTTASAYSTPPLPTDLFGEKVAIYKVGMKALRSDPYTGCALMYSYLYCGGMKRLDRKLILWFPNIPLSTWKDAATRSPNAKHVRLYRLAADAIIFSDGSLVGDAI